MKIAVMGAGGVGGYVGGRLAEAGAEVHLVARGAHLDALRRDGLTVKYPQADVHVRGIHATADPAEIGEADIILFTVKLRDTEAAARRLAPLLAPRTRIVTLQNGIDSKALIARHLPETQIAAGIIYLSAYISAPGEITSPGGMHRIVVDAMDGDPVIAAFAEAASTARHLDIDPTGHIDHFLWEKFIALSAFSAVTAVTRLPIGAVLANPHSARLYRDLLSENVAMARAKGMHFGADHVDKVEAIFRGQPAAMKSSMLVDLENGRPLELPWLSGRIHALGAELGVQTPANTAVHAALAPHVDGPPTSA